MSYQSQSFALDGEILAVIEAWQRGGTSFGEADFSDLALRMLAYQLEYDRPYARYCASLGVSAASLPDSWQAIPAVPAAAFRETTLATFDPAGAALAFQTSGTTGAVAGRHYIETRALYDAALLAGFDRFMLADGARLRYLNIVPNPSEHPESSLGYMMAQVSARRGDGQTGWYVRGETLLVAAFAQDVEAANADAQACCVATTAFGLLALLDEIDRQNLKLALPPGSRIMETGGFKGRSRIVQRSELYRRAAEAFGLPLGAIVAEYGMTELSSQYYDAPSSRGEPESRRKTAPPWLRTRVVGPDGKTLPNGTVGALVHVDLANRSSCIAIATEDLGVAFDDGLVLIGRDAGAALRGCSLDAESLQPR
jgi:acyl-CoA synthetase (AMP-forming)/AMP-acid ligase II